MSFEKSGTILIKAAGIILENRSVLMCRKRGESFYITPGGKVEAGETLEQALARELREELSMEIKSSKFFATFDGPHATKADITVRLQTYFAILSGIPQASGEIEEIRWVKSNYAAEGIPLSQISAENVIPALVAENLID